MNLAGLGSGTFETRWRGSLRKCGNEITLEVAAPAQCLARSSCRSARVVTPFIEVATGELEVSEFNANTRSSQSARFGNTLDPCRDETVDQHQRPGRVGARPGCAGIPAAARPRTCGAGRRLPDQPADGCRKLILKASCNRRISKLLFLRPQPLRGKKSGGIILRRRSSCLPALLSLTMASCVTGKPA